MSEELSREIEVLLMERYHAGDEKAVACLAEIAAITLNAAAAGKPWEDAAHDERQLYFPPGDN